MKAALFLLLFSVCSLSAAEDLQEAVKAYQSGNFSEAKAILEQIAIRDPKNQAVQNYLRMIATKQTGQLAMKKKLDAIMVPKLELKDASAKEAFAYIFQLLNRNSPQGFHPNMVWMVPDDFSKTVTLSLDNVPGSTALEYAAQMAGLKTSYEEFAIRISPE